MGFISNVLAQVQAENYVDGPMIGALNDSSTSVNFILGTGSQSSVFHVELKNSTQNTILQAIDTKQLCEGDSCLYTSVFTNLIPNNQYYAVLYKDNIAIDSTRTNVKVSDNTVSDFSFLTGSCAYQYPVGHTKFVRENIFDQMSSEQAQFMLWLGDQIYLPNNDLDRKKMFDTYMFYKTESIQRRNFLKHFFHFGIWDDHDYSYNNGTYDFPEKEHSTELYKSFWPNSGYENQGVDEGLFGTYKYEDVEFFLTDSRYYRSRYEYWGRKQLNQLKEKLLNSTATFKFVTVGTVTVVPTERNGSETYVYQTGERDELFQFIYDNNISGVIFLSGDIHRSYFAQHQPDCNSTYPLYEYTCSPLTSNAGNGTFDYADLFIHINQTHNYGKIDVSGNVGNRICNITSKDVNGNTLYNLSVNENDLKASVQPDINPLNHLVASYDFAGNTQDGSSNGYDAISNGVTSTFDRWGLNNSAYIFNNYPNTIDYPNTVLNNKTNFTVSFWMKPTESGNGLLSAASSTIGNELLVYYSSGKNIQVRIKDDPMLSLDTLRLNEWSHVVVTRDEFSGETKIYINGKISAREILPNGALEVVNGGLLFGNDQDGAGGGNLDPNQQFKGSLDELYFYDETLCLSQIQELYKKGLKEVIAVTNDTICAAGNVDFVTTGASQGDYKWYKTREGNSLIGNTDSILNINITESTTYWVSADNFWTESERVPVTIIVAPTIYIDSLTYPSNLSSWFTFEGNAIEQTVGVNNGIVSGPTLTTGKNGNPNSAYQFTNYQDLITIPSETIDGAEKLTISYWIKTASTGDGIVSAASSIAGNELLMYISSDGSMSVTMNEGTKNYTSPIINDNQWHHILFSANCYKGQAVLYIDGIPAVTADDIFNVGELEVPSGAFIIGNDQDAPGGGGLSSSQQFVGAIDEFKIYRRELTEEEVVAIYNDNTKYKEPFKFDLNTLTFCEGDTLTLNVTPIQKNVSYYLTNNNNQIVDTGIVSNDSVYFNSEVLNNETFFIKAENSFDCNKVFDSSFVVTSISSLTPSIVLSGDSICSDVQGDSYHWIFNGVSVNGNECLALSGDGTYEVYIINNPNCISDTSLAYIHNTSVITQDEYKKITLYPTPSNYELNIEVDNSFLNDSYQVIDLNGKVVLNGIIKSKSFIIDVAHFSNGVYNLIIESGNEHITKTFQKLD